METLWIVLGVGAGLLVLVALYDVTQRKHAILHNFPILGHFRYWLEAVGPELRQYIVTSNDEERPFSRDQRRWVYASSKQQNNYFGFGTDNHFEKEPEYVIVNQRAFPLHIDWEQQQRHNPRHLLPSAKVLGEARGRKHQFRPSSLVNVSAMSFGSLSGAAIEALNRGSALSGCLHNTGEGSISPYHRNGGELIWQLGTAYFGCRTLAGRFDRQRFAEHVAQNPVRAIEIKISQGAKPAHGGILPGGKVTKQIAEIRGVPQGKDCISPSGHSAFHDVDSMLDFVEMLAETSGLPVGIKSAVGEIDFWKQLAEAMETGTRGVDFITIDGGEGGTGAAPLAFTDHVSMPFRIGFPRVYRVFAERDLHSRITFIGSGRLGFPDQILLAMAFGCDMVNVAREAMLSIGCIQAQRCQTGNCPTGVATQNPWLAGGLMPTHKAQRFANYVQNLRRELIEISAACGEAHPALFSSEHVEWIENGKVGRRIHEVLGYRPDWGRASEEDLLRLRSLMLAEEGVEQALAAESSARRGQASAA